MFLTVLIAQARLERQLTRWVVKKPFQLQLSWTTIVLKFNLQLL